MAFGAEATLEIEEMFAMYERVNILPMGSLHKQTGCFRVFGTLFRPEDRQYHREYKAWRRLDPEFKKGVLEIKKRYREKNKARIKKKAAAYYKANREKILLKTKQYRDNKNARLLGQ